MLLTPEKSVLSPEELTRYSRQLVLPDMGPWGQAKLRAGRVLVVGLGGLGCPAAAYLAAAGVGTLGLAESDRVELSNLHRQVLYDTPTLGASKLAVARRRLSNLNPHVTLHEHAEGLAPAGARAMFLKYDVILDASDNFAARYLASDAAAGAGRPLVHGSIFRHEGQVTVFDPARGGPCYRCLFPEMPAAPDAPNCAEAGVFGALCGVIGSVMAMEALKLLLAAGEPLRGRLLAYDAWAGTTRTLQIKHDPHCPCCGLAPDPRIGALSPALYATSCAGKVAPPAAPAPATRPGLAKRRHSDTNERFLRDLQALHNAAPAAAPAAHNGAPAKAPPPELPFDAANPPLEIDVHAAQSWLASAAPPMVLDVREPFEVALCRLPGSKTIPLAELAARLEELPRDRPILVHCHHGGRSLRAANFLRGKGFAGAVNLRGGIHQWAEEIDPAVAKY